jgi:hypothetical protein
LRSPAGVANGDDTDANGGADRALLEQLVNINSGTMHLPGLLR